MDWRIPLLSQVLDSSRRMGECSCKGQVASGNQPASGRVHLEQSSSRPATLKEERLGLAWLGLVPQVSLLGCSRPVCALSSFSAGRSPSRLAGSLGGSRLSAHASDGLVAFVSELFLKLRLLVFGRLWPTKKELLLSLR